MSVERVTLAIFDLNYGGGGALIVERALIHLEGVLRASVNPATEMAYVEFDPAVVGPGDLVRTVQAVGFGAGQPMRR